MGDWLSLLSFALLYFVLKIVVSIVGSDARSFLPRLCRRVIVYSSGTIDDKHSARLQEEWLSHFDELEEVTAKIWHSLSVLLVGAPNLGREIGFNSSKRAVYQKVKRAFDLLFTITAATFVLLFGFVLALLVALDGGPIFQTEYKIGANGNQFRYFRFRVRKVGSEDLTVAGRLLRKFSWEELPCLLNVFRGDLALVGPMPVGLGRNAHYFGMKPGLTGIYQISDQSGEDWREEYNEAYCKKAGLRFDLVVLFKTCSINLRSLHTLIRR